MTANEIGLSPSIEALIVFFSVIFIVGFIIFVLYLIAFLTIIYRQNKIQDEELDNDPELNK